MRITLQRKIGTWTLSEMDDVHLKLLRQAAADASYSQSSEGRARLFPKPLTEEESLTEEEFLEDWKEFVIDELEEKFSEDVRTLLRDLDNAEPAKTEEGNEGKGRCLTLQLAHAQPWFSALNQARLMLAERYQFHDEHDEFVLNPTDSLLDEKEQHERFTAYLRYEFFCMIQEWLVRRAL